MITLNFILNALAICLGKISFGKQDVIEHNLIFVKNSKLRIMTVTTETFYITNDESILSGEPIIKNTRTPVGQLSNCIA